MSTSLASAIFDPRAADAALDDRYWSGYAPVSAAGIPVSADTSMKVSAVYRAVSLIANAFAQLPMSAYRALDRGREELRDNEARRLFMRAPNPYQRAFEFKRLLMGHVILRGNAFARIYRRGGQIELWPLHPDRVEGPELLASGRLRYIYTRPDNHQRETYIGGREILHVPGLSSDGLRGLALYDLARDTFGSAIAAERHGGRVFGQGVRIAGVLQSEKSFKAETRDAMETSFGAKFGGAEGVERVPVLEQGLKFEKIGMTNEDAQWLETRRFTVSDIARWFGVPPHMIGDVERSTSWGSGIEHQSIQFVQYGLMPWLVQWEQVIQDTFITDPDVFVRFNVEGLLRADSKSRHAVYALGIQNGIYNPDECREYENKNPRPGGDQYVDVATIKTGGRSSGQKQDDGRAAVFAIAATRSVLALEHEGLTRSAKEHAKDAEKFRASVVSFYGRFATEIVQRLHCGRPAAKVYCTGRRDQVLRDGLGALDDAMAESALMTLALDSEG